MRASLILSLIVGVVGTTSVSACSGSEDGPVGAVANPGSQVVRDYDVLLVPSLQGGTAGWCLTVVMPGAATCDVPDTSNGAVAVESENCFDGHLDVLDAYALVTRTTKAVSIDGGPPVRTRPQSSLRDGLRGVVVEIHYRRPPNRGTCPRFTPLGESGLPIRVASTHAVPLAYQLPTIVRWRRLAAQHVPFGVHLPRGACKIDPINLPGFSALWGVVVRRIKSFVVPLGPGFTSCASTVYASRGGVSMQAGVLVNAEHPGSAPPSLPDMTPVVGHPGVFQARGSGGYLVGRRLPGAWLVVEEEGRIGLRVPVELLEDLRATVRL